MLVARISLDFSEMSFAPWFAASIICRFYFKFSSFYKFNLIRAVRLIGRELRILILKRVSGKQLV